MSALEPQLVFDLIERQLPDDLHPHILIIGSLAAAYHYRDRLRVDKVNTKDADVAVQPAGAVEESRRIAERLFEEGWRPRSGCDPGAPDAPDDELAVIRLHPPGTDAYFLELLALPQPSQTEPRQFHRLELRGGWYVLPAFRYLGLASWQQQTAHNGLRYAAPEMMALANLLAHPTIGTARISEPIDGQRVRRAAKDLGRVLALARLAERAETEAWIESWSGGLRTHFPGVAPDLATRAANGLTGLLADRGALVEAHHTADHGLLQGFGVDVEQLREVGQQLLVDVLEPLARRAPELR